MSAKGDRLELLLRLCALEVDTSRRAALRRGKERSAADVARRTAANRRSEAERAEAASLAARNADPGQPAALDHSRACASRSEQADVALRACRSRLAEADAAARQARRDVLYAEARHEGVLARVRAEIVRDRRRVDRRNEEEGRGKPWFLQEGAR